MTLIKNNNAVIKVTKQTYNNKEYIDIRKYYRNVETDEWLPTKKGISFNPDLKNQIIEALKSL